MIVELTEDDAATITLSLEMMVHSYDKKILDTGRQTNLLPKKKVSVIRWCKQEKKYLRELQTKMKV